VRRADPGESGRRATTHNHRWRRHNYRNDGRRKHRRASVNPGSFKKKLAKQKEALNPPPPPTKDDCGPWDGKYNPNGEGEAIKNARYDVALGEKRLAEETEWRNNDPDWVECAGYFIYDTVKGDPVRHAQDQLTRSKWQVEIYEAAYRQGKYPEARTG